jgi:hypothetical protein
MMRFCSLLLIVATAVVGSGHSARAQTRTETIEVEDPYPMRAAILKINELSGSPINLEGMQIDYADDMLQMANGMVPITRQLVVPIVVDDVTGKLRNLEAVESALSALVSTYNSADFPGEYKLELANESFFVLPVEYRDAAGITRPMAPVLSTLISLPAEKRTLHRTVLAILDELSRTSGFHILDMRNAMNGMDNPVVFGATNEPAGHVLARFFSQKCMSGNCSAASLTGDEHTWDTGLSFTLIPFLRSNNPRLNWCGPYQDQQRCYAFSVKRNWNRPPYTD